MIYHKSLWNLGTIDPDMLVAELQGKGGYGLRALAREERRYTDGDRTKDAQRKAISSAIPTTTRASFFTQGSLQHQGQGSIALVLTRAEKVYGC